MNKKDYKAIAEIIKENNFASPDVTNIINDLADYFEKEAKLKVAMRLHNESDFDRKQFKKWCWREE